MPVPGYKGITIDEETIAVLDEYVETSLCKSRAEGIRSLLAQWRKEATPINPGAISSRGRASANTLNRSEYRISPKVLNQEPRQTAGGGARSHEMDPAGFTPGFHPEPAPNGQEIGLLARSLAGLPWEGAGWAL